MAVKVRQTDRHQESIERAERRVPINKYAGFAHTVQYELKMIETRILMRKAQVKIHLDANNFEMLAQASEQLQKDVKEYNRIYNNTYI